LGNGRGRQDYFVRNLNNKLKSISSMKPFGIVIWVTISQNLDMKKVQTQIAERLNLEIKMGESMERLAINFMKDLRRRKLFCSF
jgi:disease resistance protein RPS2